MCKNLCGASCASHVSRISKWMLIIRSGEQTADRAFREYLQQPLVNHPPSFECKWFNVCAQQWFGNGP